MNHRRQSIGLRLLRALALMLIAVRSPAAGGEAPAAEAGAELRATPAASTPVAEVTFVAFDTETTGLSAQRERLVEIAAVKFRNGRVLAEKTWLINPGRPMPPAAEQVHHISDTMVRDKPDFKTVYPEFAQFIGDAVLLAHNARFDVAFVSAECTRHSLPPPPNPVLDTLPLFRRWFPQFASHSIASLSTNLNLTAGALHRAQSDTMSLVLIFEQGRRQESPAWTLEALSQTAHQPLRFTRPPP